MKQTRSRTILVIVGIAIFSLIGYQTIRILWKGDSSQAGIRYNTKGGTAQAEEDAAPPLPVRIIPVRQGEISDVIQETATLASSLSISVYSPLAGIAESVLVREGESVKKGVVLVKLDGRELAINLERTKIRLEREKREWNRQKTISEQALGERQVFREAKYAFQLKKIILKKFVNERKRRESEARRIKVSYQNQLASEKEWDETRFALAQAKFEEAQARLELEKATDHWERIRTMEERSLIDEEEYSAAKFAFRQARSDYNLAKLRYSQATIRAPSQGVVVRLDIKKGDYISPNTKLLTLEDLKALEAVIHLPEIYWGAIKEKQRVEVIPEALPNLKVSGTVLRKSPTIDPENGTFKLTAILDEIDNDEVKPGMFATLQIQLDARPNALLVPRQAILGEEEERFVYLVKKERAIRRPVKLGVVSNEDQEIISGIKLGEMVVISGQYSLKPGSRVNVLADSKKEDTIKGKIN